MPDLDPEQLDLRILARDIAMRLGSQPALGFVVGRTLLRDAVAEALGCSLLKAEQIVDTMILRRFFYYEERPDGQGAWVSDPECV